MKATSGVTLQPLDDKAASLPFSATFEKVAEGETGPYVLKITDIAKDSISVTVQIVPSVVLHGDTKVRNIPDHAMDPGQVWSISELAAADKVTVTAKGFAPLELTVP